MKVAKERQTKIKNQKQYFFSRDRVLLWTIILLVTLFFLVISFLNVPWLTTLHSYSFNVLFGMFSILFYLLIILLSIWKIFNLKSTYKYWIFNFNLGRLIFFFINIIILGSVIYYTIHQVEHNSKNFFTKYFSSWFVDFSNSSNYLLPQKYTPGVIGTFINSILNIPGKKLGFSIAYIISIVLLSLSVISFFISNSFFKMIFSPKSKKNKEKLQNQSDLKIKEEDIEIIDNKEVVNSNIQILEANSNSNKNIDSAQNSNQNNNLDLDPFDDEKEIEEDSKQKDNNELEPKEAIDSPSNENSIDPTPQNLDNSNKNKEIKKEDKIYKIIEDEENLF